MFAAPDKSLLRLYWYPSSGKSLCSSSLQPNQCFFGHTWIFFLFTRIFFQLGTNAWLAGCRNGLCLNPRMVIQSLVFQIGIGNVVVCPSRFYFPARNPTSGFCCTRLMGSGLHIAICDLDSWLLLFLDDSWNFVRPPWYVYDETLNLNHAIFQPSILSGALNPLFSGEPDS